jgi:Ion channel
MKQRRRRPFSKKEGARNLRHVTNLDSRVKVSLSSPCSAACARSSSMGKRRRKLLPIAAAAVLAVWVVWVLAGAAVFQAFEEDYNATKSGDSGGDKNGTCTDTGRRQEWNYFNSVYFCVVMLTTIGFGDLAPESDGGKAFALVYGSLGLPLTFYLVSLFIEVVLTFIPAHHGGLGDSDQREPETALQKCKTFYRRPTFLTLLGFWVFVLLSAIIYALAEEWRYLDAVYFTFVSVTTIGFGDFFPKETGSKTFLIFSSLLGITFYSFLINKIGRNYSKQKRKAEDLEQEMSDVSVDSLIAAIKKLDDAGREQVRDAIA